MSDNGSAKTEGDGDSVEVESDDGGADIEAGGSRLLQSVRVADVNVAPDYAAAQAIVGHLLAMPNAIVAIPELKPKHIPDLRLRRVFEAIASLQAQDKYIDAISVRNEIGDKAYEKLLPHMFIGNEKRGWTWIDSLRDATGLSHDTPRRLEIWAEALIENYQRRAVAALASTVADELASGEHAATILSVLTTSIDAIRSEGTSAYATITPTDCMETWMQERRDYIENGVPPGYDMPWPNLTELLRLEDGKLYVIAGRPAHHKSFVALAMAQAVAATGKVAYFATLEMPAGDVLARMLAQQLRTTTDALKMPDTNTMASLYALQADMPPSIGNVYIDDTRAFGGRLTGEEITQRVMALRARGVDVGIMFVDYLQLMGDASARTAESRRVEIDRVSRALQLLSLQLHIPVVAVAQLSRACEYRADKRGVLADLRESGQIEQDAHAAMFCYRPDQYRAPGEEYDYKVEITVRKNRGGQTGTAVLRWLPGRITLGMASDEAAPVGISEV